MEKDQNTNSETPNNEAEEIKEEELNKEAQPDTSEIGRASCRERV